MNSVKKAFDEVDRNNFSVHTENFDDFRVSTLGEAKTLSKHIVYGLTEVNPEGVSPGKESRTTLFISEKECFDAAYERYCEAWRIREERGVFLADDVLLSKVQFTQELQDSGYVVIELPGLHIQFEHFSQELMFPERQVTNEKLSSLAEKIEQASSCVEEENKKDKAKDWFR